MPPRLGASSALAGGSSAASVPAATESASRNRIFPLPSWSFYRLFITAEMSFVEPHRREILVQEMAGADLPAFDVRAVRHDPVPPYELGGVRLGVHHLLLEVDHQPLPLLRLGFV